MRWTTIFLSFGAIVTTASVSSAQSQSPMQTIYQKNFYGDSSGRLVNRSPTTGCSTITVVDDCNVSLNGVDALPVLINPWESVSINILCAQVIFMPSAPVSASTMFFAGNSYSPDVMTWGVPRSTGGGSAKMCYPAGTSYPFPAAAKGAPENGPGQNNFRLPHLDVHVQGTPRSRLFGYLHSKVSYMVYLSVWYTKNAQ
jgi:hypothetical protein